MSEVSLQYRPQQNKSAIHEDSLTNILDAVFGKPIGQCVWRGPNSWQRGPLCHEVVSLVGVSATTGGGIKTWQPASGATAVVLRCIVNVATASSGAANLTVGVGSSATTSYTNLITATSIASTGIIDSITNQITATAAVALAMPIGNFITFTGSATTVGFVGSALIEYWLP